MLSITPRPITAAAAVLALLLLSPNLAHGQSQQSANHFEGQQIPGFLSTMNGSWSIKGASPGGVIMTGFPEAMQLDWTYTDGKSFKGVAMEIREGDKMTDFIAGWGIPSSRPGLLVFTVDGGTLRGRGVQRLVDEVRSYNENLEGQPGLNGTYQSSLGDTVTIVPGEGDNYLVKWNARSRAGFGRKIGQYFVVGWDNVNGADAGIMCLKPSGELMEAQSWTDSGKVRKEEKLARAEEKQQVDVVLELPNGQRRKVNLPIPPVTEGSKK